MTKYLKNVFDNGNKTLKFIHKNNRNKSGQFSRSVFNIPKCKYPVKMACKTVETIFDSHRFESTSNFATSVSDIVTSTGSHARDTSTPRHRS